MLLARLNQHLARREYVQARREALRLVQEGTATGSDLAQACRGAALANWALQEVHAAIHWGKRSLDSIDPLCDHALATIMRGELGEFFLTLGDTHEAVRYLQSSLADLEKSGELTELTPRLWQSLGQAFSQRIDYTEAAQAFDRAALLFRDLQMHRSAVEAVRLAGANLLYACLPEQARPRLDAVSEYLRQAPDDRISACLLCDLALYYRLHGALKKSTDLCEEALIPGRPGVDPSILATACSIAGNNALDLGCRDEAATFAALALEYAITTRHPRQINQAVALRRRIHQSDRTK